MEQGLYLFCVAQWRRLPPLPLEGEGLDGRSPLETTIFQDLAAIWSPVPVADFCGPAAEKGMGELTWIGPRVIRHQEVVAGVMRHAPVFPARFGTIFSSATNLIKVLQAHHDAIAGFLEGLSDQAEWAVKGLVDRSRAKEKLFSLKLAGEAARLTGLTPGRRYFQEQRLRALCDLEWEQQLGKICRELWRELRKSAARFQERRLLSRETTGSDKDMVLNWAFLVSERGVPGFQARIQEANARYADWGLRLESSGPWPPYSFTPSLELEAGA